MEWSIYNYDFIDSKGILFINPFTNNLLKIAEEKRKDILFCKKGDVGMILVLRIKRLVI